MQEVYNHSYIGSQWLQTLVASPPTHRFSNQRDFGSYEDFFTTAFKGEARKQFCFSAWVFNVDKAGN
jgi:hypothetical protein